jgi:hypothetical protein
MKQTILATVVTMMVATSAFAQTRRNEKLTVQTAPAQSYSYTPSYYANNEMNVLLGFQAGAPNLGVDYARMNNGAGFGGYFFMQTNKDKNSATIVSQVLAFGGLFKVNVVDTAQVRVFVAPGVGIAMVKDATINTTTLTKSDETIIGPMWKMGVLYKVNTNFNLGLETTHFGNFFNDSSLNNYAAPAHYYSVVGAFAF